MTDEIVQDTASPFRFTPDEVPEFLRDEYFDPELRGKVNALQVLVVNEIRRAVAAEREACAKLLQQTIDAVWSDPTIDAGPEICIHLQHVVDTMRLRGEVQE